MSNIIKTDGEISPTTKFRMLNGKCERFKDNVGRVFNAVAYMVIEDNDNYILFIETDDGDILATNSKTILRTFSAMVDCFPLPIKSIEIISGRSKNGREYYDLDFQN